MSQDKGKKNATPPDAEGDDTQAQELAALQQQVDELNATIAEGEEATLKAKSAVKRVRGLLDALREIGEVAKIPPQTAILPLHGDQFAKIRELAAQAVEQAEAK